MEKVKTFSKKKEKLKEPSDYDVILLNDNYTTMDFVVNILISVFHKNIVEAQRIMMNVHRSGHGLAGRYSFDIAQTKALQVQSIARQNNFPLKCIVKAA
ncbi:MAG: ATP-dependent Clp protease adaptor ClpS [Endomicrobium sp.]|jgi:ATP-dependent Clp protease adaptor protein ClpS|nr:ATP-dependent Clp protease adaptor ClpS [Endomicrobium sp.]